ncbi:MAG: hypothetical protein RMK30_08135 [Anaerolineae bacterium]|nr:hypothetical protein [Anaerolineae bacterium]MDW8102830.1 hypothetical protein [Anaerolineae bacterium]
MVREITIGLLLGTMLIACSPPSLQGKTFLAGPAQAPTWVVNQRDTVLEIAYGSGTHFPQYGALHLESSYFRLNYGPNSEWGTSIILLPAFWSNGVYHQGAPITASWKVMGSNLQLAITGTIASLSVRAQVDLFPPAAESMSAQVAVTVEGSVPLDSRPGEAFKPVMLSSMHISPTIWDTQAAFAGCQTWPIPESGWLIPPTPPVSTSFFGLLGGTSEWKPNAPTIWIVMDRPMQVAGWVTASHDPNDDNVGLWAAAEAVLPSWRYRIIALSGTHIHCSVIPLILK